MWLPSMHRSNGARYPLELVKVSIVCSGLYGSSGPRWTTMGMPELFHSNDKWWCTEHFAHHSHRITSNAATYWMHRIIHWKIWQCVAFESLFACWGEAKISRTSSAHEQNWRMIGGELLVHMTRTVNVSHWRSYWYVKLSCARSWCRC